MNGIRQSPLLGATPRRARSPLNGRWPQYTLPISYHIAPASETSESPLEAPMSRPRKFNNPGLHSRALEMSKGRSLQDIVVTKSQLRRARRKAAAKETKEDREPQSTGLLGVLTETWMISWMFIFMPLGFAAYMFNLGPVIVFVTNFLAIVPQAWIMGKATEDLAATSGVQLSAAC
eukprot:Blabericola_migrator_1__5325@NODE_272_length_10504_cov_138_380473_g227_i0_p6_GENE_NODE_272_length_10504_cov_138_380473_g227_i0NODE_272_length_10504_cov_138_380473_g227_i0_p6_ORF_typecomplete_len176_score12_09_NODE_272_length_10504_cov_138_380473_g227_i088049331